MSHVADQRLNAMREATLGDCCLQTLDGGSVAIDGDDGARGELSQVDRLSARSATEVEHPGQRRQSRAKLESFGGASTVARPLPGKGLEELEEYVLESFARLAHVVLPSNF